MTRLNIGIASALAAAALFGAGTPVSKLLLGETSPLVLAGLLYLGSGTGLFLSRRLYGARRARIPGHELLWLAGAIVAGGIIAPVLLLHGLSKMPAASAALLLNAEGFLPH